MALRGARMVVFAPFAPALALVFALALVAPLGGGGACAPFSAADPEDAGAADGAEADAAAPPEASPPDGPDGAALTYAAAVLADRPIAYWRLGEIAGSTTAHSLVGGAAHDALIMPVDGGPTFGQAGAIVGDRDTSLGFSVDGQFVQPRVDVDFDFNGTASFSLEAWLNPSVIDDLHRHPFIKDGTDLQGRQEYGVYIRRPIGSDAVVAFERIVDNTKLETSATAQNGDVITGNAWHHVVATYDGMLMILYVDGVERSQIVDTRPQPTKPGPFLFGAKNPSGGTVLGMLDEVAVYDRALPTASVRAHFSLGSTGKP